MPANVEYPTLTSETVLWENRAAAEAFFNNFVVPDATASTPGVVTKGAALSYTNFTGYTINNYSMMIDPDGNAFTTPNKDTFDELREKVLALTTAFNGLLTRLRNAGMLES